MMLDEKDKEFLNSLTNDIMIQIGCFGFGIAVVLCVAMTIATQYIIEAINK